MDPAIVRVPAPVAFRDGLGDRLHTTSPSNEPLEVLALRPDLTTVPAFEFALRERVSRLAGFRHACYGPLRGVSRLGPDASTLGLVSDRVIGDRLSQVLFVADRQLLPLTIGAGLSLIRQLVDAVAILHETVRDVSHGALAPERIVVTPDARLVIVEHVLGAALGSLQLSRDRYWKELRIALPLSAGAPHFDRRADVTQVGAVAVAIIAGRPLGDADYPDRMREIVERVAAVTSVGLEPLREPLGEWLFRALQLDARNAFASAVDARAELDTAIRESGYTPAPAELKAFLAHYHASASQAPAPMPSVPIPMAPTAALPVTAPVAATPAPTPLAAVPIDSPPIGHVPPAAPSARSLAPPPSPAAEAPAPHVPRRIDPLEEFPEEAEEAMPKRTAISRRRLAAVAALLIALASAGTVAARRYLTPVDSPAPIGTLAVNTNPAGAVVVIDGQSRGMTPVTMTLTPGAHVLEIVSGEERRSIPLTITAGGQVSQFIELPKAPAAVGELHVRTEPGGARVSIDGQPVGASPLTIPGLAPGTHVVTLANEWGSLEETVTIQPGTTASLVVPLKASRGAPVSGWISVSSPVDVQLYENEQLIGSSRTARIMVPAGRHELEIVNEALGYRATRVVTVSPGHVSPVRLDWPRGTLAINALPWAEVFIGGERVGETPIGQVSLPIGSHEVVFRHPELGEQRHHITVTLGTPSRLSVDLRKR